MPEGHTIHRLARQQQRLFGGRPVALSSPQGRFVEGAAAVDGHVLRRTEAYGKHLLHRYDNGLMVHIHLGLYGKFLTGVGEPPEPVGALRLRMVGDGVWSDLRGATACELLDKPGWAAIRARLGPDPLRPDADPALAANRIARSKTTIAALLMDQKVLAGVGNVYRAELLFRHGVDPFLPGVQLAPAVWDAMWADLVVLMTSGVRLGRIVTVRPEDRVRRRGILSREEAAYVYRRAGLPCRICSTPVRTEVLVGRNLFWCPNCQAPGNGTR
ncbi:DNA-formamidopyrimidine glycosylase family protein [Jatrophihabitans sp.]|uniref:Fpg/Nei family DNA glycosylase n=1 Tax=Jatrophihabitans sp. TaxID=1932789 RepID=UPI0030C75F5C|nr:Endonuclease-8 [Jatrophihabitans sp.]